MNYHMQYNNENDKKRRLYAMNINKDGKNRMIKWYMCIVL